MRLPGAGRRGFTTREVGDCVEPVAERPVDGGGELPGGELSGEMPVGEDFHGAFFCLLGVAVEVVESLFLEGGGEAFG